MTASVQTWLSELWMCLQTFVVDDACELWAAAVQRAVRAASRRAQ